MKFVLAAQPVGPIGSGLGGGVEQGVANTARALADRGHGVRVVAPRGSVVAGFVVDEIDGTLAPSILDGRGAGPQEVSHAETVLDAMWRHVARLATAHDDVVVNFAIDRGAFRASLDLATPVFHVLSLPADDRLPLDDIAAAVRRRAGSVAVHSRAQGRSYSFATELPVIFDGVPVAADAPRAAPTERVAPDTGATPAEHVAWLGRIRPDKGLADAAEAARRAGVRLVAYGRVDDARYFADVMATYAATVEYAGFVASAATRDAIRDAQAVVVTSRWNDPLPLVMLDALACGTPVVGYRAGGLAEAVDHGRTGWLAECGDVRGVAAYLRRVHELDRHACWATARDRFSLPAYADRIERWVDRRP